MAFTRGQGVKSVNSSMFNVRSRDGRICGQEVKSVHSGEYNIAAEPHRLILVLVFPKVKVQKMQVTVMALKHHMRATTWRTQVMFFMIKFRSIAGLEVTLTA